MSSAELGEKLLKRVGLERQDASRALPMALAYGLVLASLYLLKPVRNALFLDVLGVEKLPYGLLLLAVAGGLTAWAYSRVSARASTRRLLTSTFIALMVAQLIFRFLLESEATWVYYALFVGVGMYSLLATTLVWLMANSVFDAREARRTFGFIGAGGIAGAVVGGLFTRQAAPWLGTENLIFVSAALLGLALVLLLRVPRRSTSKRKRRKKDVTAPFSDIFKSALVVQLALLAAGVAVIAVIVDVQFNEVVQRQYPNKDDKAAFFGTFFASLSAFGFIFQLFITPRILRRFGAAFGVSLLPVLMGAGSLALLFIPNLLTVGITKGADNGLRHSIHKAATEVLFLPVSGALKRRAKLFLDTTVDTAASGLGALVVLLLVDNFGVAHEQLSIVSIVLVVLVMLTALRLRKSHVNAFRAALERRTLDFSQVTDPVAEAGLLDALLESLQSDNDRNVLYALEAARGLRSNRLQITLTRLVQHNNHNVRLAALQHLQDQEASVPAQLLQGLLKDPNSDLRVAALDLLIDQTPDRETELLSVEFDSGDPARLEAALGCLILRSSEAKASLLTSKRVTALRATEAAGIQPLLAEILAGAEADELKAEFAELMNASTDTKAGALRGIARFDRSDLIDWVIQQLHSRSLRAQARETLVRLGGPVTQPLLRLLKDHETDRIVRLSIPRILERALGDTAWALLVPQLKLQDPGLRAAVLKSLVRIRGDEGPPASAKQMRAVIVQETEAAAERRQAIAMLSSASEERPLLLAALQEQQELGRQTLLLALGLYFDPLDISSATTGLRSVNREMQASALELLDYLLDGVLNPSLEQSVLRSLEQNHGPEGELDDFELMPRLIRSRHPWIRACALHALTREEARAHGEELRQACKASDPFVRESAQQAVAKAV